MSRRIARLQPWLSPLVPALALALAALPVAAQQTPPAPAPPSSGQAPAPPAWMRDATRLDLEGHTADARRVLQATLDSARAPAARASAARAMAMSWAFDGDCARTVEYEQKVIDYWKTREAAEPQNAFYQEGEVANEGARVCIDAGDLATAERWYRLGSELGNREPAPRTHPQSLWDFRLAHALARIAARRHDAAEAARQVAAARHALDADSAMARQQERFFPYLQGYVALYAGDAAAAAAHLERALAMRGNERDPFLHVLLGMAYEKAGRAADALTQFRTANELATGHNPPSAFVHRFMRQRQGENPPPDDTPAATATR